MKKVIIFSVIVLAIAGWMNRERLMNLGTPAFKLSIKDGKPDGTPPRVEREFKMDLTGDGVKKYSRFEIAQFISQILDKAVKNKSLWQAPKFVANPYWVDLEPHSFLYRDIYLDTKDGLLYKNSIGYRIRNRWDNTEAYKEHELDPNNPKYYPYREEYQLKTNRVSLGDGTNNVTETRFEFRNESSPFSVQNPAPGAPWNLKEFLPYIQSGRYKEYITSSGHELAKELSKVTDKKEIYLKPVLVINDERQRLHFHIKSPYGWGPNPDQTFIITLDNPKVYDLSYLKFLENNTSKKPAPRSEYLQLEFEFERNVSTVIDEEIVKAQAKNDTARVHYLGRVLNAFLADELMMKTVVTEGLKEKGIIVSPTKSESKYYDAYSVIYEKK